MFVYLFCLSNCELARAHLQHFLGTGYSEYLWQEDTWKSMKNWNLFSLPFDNLLPRFDFTRSIHNILNSCCYHFAYELWEQKKLHAHNAHNAPFKNGGTQQMEANVSPSSIRTRTVLWNKINPQLIDGKNGIRFFRRMQLNSVLPIFNKKWKL